jgi:hypothetical protein
VDRAARKLLFERIVDEAMPRDERLALERRRHDRHAKVFAAGARSGVARMQVALVDDRDLNG